jgi:hypothetical protein
MSLRRPRSGAIEAVLCNEDLLAHILGGHIGPTTLVAVSRVCKAWHSMVRTNETVLRMVALYQGGLTKTIFCGLFAVMPREAVSLPHAMHRRRNGGSYYLFGKPAIDEILAKGGMLAMRDRLAKRSKAIARGRVLYELQNGRSRTEQIWLEDRLHARLLC